MLTSFTGSHDSFLAPVANTGSADSGHDALAMTVDAGDKVCPLGGCRLTRLTAEVVAGSTVPVTTNSAEPPAPMAIWRRARSAAVPDRGPMALVL